MSEINPQDTHQDTNLQNACDETPEAQNSDVESPKAAESTESTESADAVEGAGECGEICDDAETADAEAADAEVLDPDEEVPTDKGKEDDKSNAAAEAPAPAEPKKDETDWKDAYIRLAADFENYRKRTSKEQDDIRKRERERVIKAWLEVYDNTERAIFSLPEKEGPWFEGFSQLLKQMDKCLSTFHIVPADDLGKPFDPKKHEAIQTLPNPAMENGTIMHVESRGFLYDTGEVARIARVIVVKNPS